jgi:hypothetical protein
VAEVAEVALGRRFRGNVLLRVVYAHIGNAGCSSRVLSAEHVRGGSPREGARSAKRGAATGGGGPQAPPTRNTYRAQAPPTRNTYRAPS